MWAQLIIAVQTSALYGEHTVHHFSATCFLVNFYEGQVHL